MKRKKRSYSLEGGRIISLFLPGGGRPCNCMYGEEKGGRTHLFSRDTKEKNRPCSLLKDTRRGKEEPKKSSPSASRKLGGATPPPRGEENGTQEEGHCARPTFQKERGWATLFFCWREKDKKGRLIEKI